MRGKQRSVSEAAQDKGRRPRRPWCFRHKESEETFAKSRCSAVSHTSERSDKTRTGKAHNLPVERQVASPVPEITSFISFCFYLKGFPRGGSLIMPSVWGDVHPLWGSSAYSLLRTGHVNSVVPKCNHLIVKSP